MSPWPTVVIHAVFVEQANSVCYLLCSRFISENCIVPPFGEWVMECGRKQKVRHFPVLWQCCTTLLKGSHILPSHHLTFQHTTCVRFLNQTDSVWLCFVFLSMWEKSCMPASLSVNFYPLTQPVWWTHSSGRHVLGRQTGGGPYGCSFLKSLNIHRHGSFDPCTVTLTPRMTILWCGEPRRGRLWKPHVVKLWEQHRMRQPLRSGEESMLETHGSF